MKPIKVTTAIQKLGKPKGTIENLRSITVLSMLRKVLAICLKKTYNTEIRQRKSTTEHVFGTKILA